MKENRTLLFSKVMIAALLAASSAFAIPRGPCEQKQEVCCEKPAEGPHAFLYPKDLGLSCPTNFYATGEYLLMQAQEDGLEYAITDTTTPGAFPLTGGNIQGFSDQHHDWNWGMGFRAALGFYLNHDDWNVDLRWTYLRGKNDTTSSIRGGTGALLPLWLPPSVIPSAENDGASARWKVYLNTLDISLGKPFHISRNFICHPAFGLRAAWIDQNYLARYFGAFTAPAGVDGAEMQAQNDFWGVGLRAGIFPEWKMGSGFNFFGRLAGSLLYGKFDVSQESAIATMNFNIERDFYTVVPNIELAAGLNWGHTFSKDRYLVSLRIAYEFHEWFKQNRLSRFYDANPVALEQVSHGDLSFNGFSFGLQFDF